MKYCVYNDITLSFSLGRPYHHNAYRIYIWKKQMYKFNLLRNWSKRNILGSDATNGLIVKRISSLLLYEFDLS